MDAPTSQKTEIPDSRDMNIPCGECNRETRHQILALTNAYWHDLDADVRLYVEYFIVQCKGCLTISFCEESQFSEDIEYDKVSGVPYPPPKKRKFYPNRIAGRPMIQESHLLPEGVYNVYTEAHSALCAQLNIMAGFGIRAIVESVCKDKQMSGRNLQQKIDSLAEAGLITQAGSVILHSLRFMGNAAAHEMKAHTLKELNTGFDVVEYLLKGVYILPRQADDLPRS